MAGTARKRPHDGGGRVPAGVVSKKRRRQQARDYHSDSDDQDQDGGDKSGDAQDFDAINLLDSDEDDIHNATVDDGAPSGSDNEGSSSEEEEDRARQRRPVTKTPGQSKGKLVAKVDTKAAKANHLSDDDDGQDGEDGDSQD